MDDDLTFVLKNVVHRITTDLEMAMREAGTPAHVTVNGTCIRVSAVGDPLKARELGSLAGSPAPIIRTTLYRVLEGAQR